MDWLREIVRLGGKPKGVVHVGAHLGQEALSYREGGIDPAIYVEALPHLLPVLKNEVSQRQGHLAVNALCAEADGQEVCFRIASDNGASSSYLDFGWYRDVHPEVDWSSRINLLTTRLDGVLERLSQEHRDLEWGRIDTLVLHVQGTERRVMEGAPELIKSVRWIGLAVNDGGLYRGDADFDEIFHYLRNRGFSLRHLEMTSHRWGHALFERSDAATASALTMHLVSSLAITDHRLAADAYEALGKVLVAAGQESVSAAAFEAAAAIDLADAELQACWGGPLNGQDARRHMFRALVNAAGIGAIVETGTFRGTTTEWIADWFSGPIYTCEAEPRFYAQARDKLSRFNHVQVFKSDSRRFLTEIAPQLPQDQTTLYYLDAHWSEDLPLLDEIRQILARGAPAVIMIDDFEIITDQGYMFDDYGPGKRLSLELIAAAPLDGVSLFFPSTPSALETGARRGCVVLATAGVDGIASVPELRPLGFAEHRIFSLAAFVHRTSSQATQIAEEAAGLRKALADRDASIAALESTRSDPG